MLRRPHSTNQGLNPKTGSAPSSILHQKLASSRLSCRTSLASVPISPQVIRIKSSPRTKTTKFRYLIYSIFFLFGLFMSRFYLPPPAYAIRPVDAKNKNTEKIPKTCPKGSYLNPETNRCRKFKAQKMKTCPRGYFLNVLTHRCNKNNQILLPVILQSRRIITTQSRIKNHSHPRLAQQAQSIIQTPNVVIKSNNQNQVSKIVTLAIFTITPPNGVIRRLVPPPQKPVQLDRIIMLQLNVVARLPLFRKRPHVAPVRCVTLKLVVAINSPAPPLLKPVQREKF